MITSSHNPAQWNGVKYKAWYGGSGKPSIIAEIESFLGQPVAKAAQPAADRGVRLPSRLSQSHRELRRSRPDRQVGAEVRHRLHVRRRPHHPLRHFHSARRRARPDSRAIVDPLFPGINPEPIEPHIRALRRGRGGQPLPCGPVHRWRCRPHRRHRRARQLRRSAQDLLRPAELGAAPQGLARRGDPRLQHHQNARPHLPRSTAASCSSTASASSLFATTCWSARS